MAQGDLLRVFAALEGAGVRYLVVGGVAVVLHGHPRFTADLDLVVSLVPENARAAMKALSALGYRPRPPMEAAGFADPATRRRWVEENGMRVFTPWSEAAPATEVDLFVEEPFPFEEAYARRVDLEVEGTSVQVAAIPDLLALKAAAGRPQDAEEIEALRRILRLRGEGGNA